jgi:hypothetical protein
MGCRSTAKASRAWKTPKYQYMALSICQLRNARRRRGCVWVRVRGKRVILDPCVRVELVSFVYISILFTCRTRALWTSSPASSTSSKLAQASRRQSPSIFSHPISRYPDKSFTNIYSCKNTTTFNRRIVTYRFQWRTSLLKPVPFIPSLR